MKILKEELEKLKDKVKENAFTCSQCSKNRTGENPCFYNSATNDGKKFCSKECFAEYYGEKCDVCSNKIRLNDKSYYQDAKNKSGTLCSSCWKTKKNQENNSPSSSNQEEPIQEERNERPLPSSTSPNRPPSHQPNSDKLLTYQEAKEKIKQGGWVDVGELNITEYEKEKLRKLQISKEETPRRGFKLNTPGKIGVTILSITGFVILLTILIKSRKKSKKN